MAEPLDGYLEELAKDYLAIVEGYNLVDVEVPSSPKHPPRLVAGVRGKSMMIISCRGRLGDPENWKKDVVQLKRARIAKNLQNLEVRHTLAYANYPNKVVENDIREFLKTQGVRLLFLDEMAEEVLIKSDGF